MSDTEHGWKWWVRYVIVPLVGGGGLIAIIVTLMSQPRDKVKPVAPSEPITVEDVSNPTSHVSPLTIPAKNTARKPVVLIIDSKSRSSQIGRLADLLEHFSDSMVPDEEPIHIKPPEDFSDQCRKLTRKNASVVVAHWHSLRRDGVTDFDAQEELLRGLSLIHGELDFTHFVLYSRAFGKQSSEDSWKVIRAAVARVSEAETDQRTLYDAVLKQTQIVTWPEDGDDGDEAEFIRIVRDQTEKAIKAQ